jgi:uncharacterized protein
MDILIATFGIVALLVLLMAVGVIFGRKPMAGSCGGYKALDIECAAGCKKPCDKRLARMQAQAQEKAARESAC